MNATETIPFCQRNVRLWVTLLIISGVLVLGFAVWIAVEEPSLENGKHLLRFQSSGAGIQHAPPPHSSTTQPGSTMPAAFQPNSPGGRMQVVGMQGRAMAAGHQQTSFHQAVEIIRPSVVNINAIRSGTASPFLGNPQGARFIDPFDGVPDKVIGQVAYESVGSGLIIDTRGYVVTNNHLVSNATSIMITMFHGNNKHLTAALVAVDPRSDLALLRLQEPGTYPAAQFADSTKVEVGDWVLAVGNPFGLQNTVTSGIISGRRNSIAISGVEYRGLLQTDAPINQGSSGGPLVDLRGKVVGINTAIYAPTGVFSGTGFAIPANRVGGFIARAMAAQVPIVQPRAVAQNAPFPPSLRGAVQNTPFLPSPRSAGSPRVGLEVIDVSPALAAKLFLPQAGGVFINGVLPDSPGEEAELQRGDVITSLNGYTINNTTSFQMVLAGVMPRQRVGLTVWRKGRSRALSLKINSAQLPGPNQRMMP